MEQTFKYLHSEDQCHSHICPLNIKTTARSLLWGLCVGLWTTFYAGPTILGHIIGPCNRWVSLHPDSLNNGSHDTVSQPAEYHTKSLGF